MKRRPRAAPAAVPDARRPALQRSLGGRFWLRFHATLLIAGTFATGFLVNFALLHAGLAALLPRWLLAVAAGYATFFLLVRFWLAYVGVRPLAGGGSSSSSSSSSSLPDDGGGSLDLPWRGGGGRFGGAGATGDWGGAGAKPLPVANFAGGGTSSGGSTASGFGDLVDGVALDDAAPLVLGLVVLALVLALFGSAVLFVWLAPELLVDAAFAAMLAGGALPGLARAQAADWHASLFRATWKPLAAVVVATVAGALALSHWFPGARTLAEAFGMLR